MVAKVNGEKEKGVREVREHEGGRNTDKLHQNKDYRCYIMVNT